MEQSENRLKSWIDSNLYGEWLDENTFKLDSPQKATLPDWIQIGQPGEGGNDFLLASGQRVEIVI